MALTIIIFLKYILDDSLMLYFFSKVLGRKYSLKVTMMVTYAATVFFASMKLLEVFDRGIGIFILQVVNWSEMFLYTILLFGGIIGKRIFALMILMFMFIATELMTYPIAAFLTGDISLLQDTAFSMIVILLQIPLEIAGIRFLVYVWKFVDRMERKTGKMLCLGSFLPASYACIMFHLGYSYTMAEKVLPTFSILGELLGILATVYMFVLFFRANRRERAEYELKALRKQYELERIRYEQLMKNQEEAAKLRHDFQNYVLTAKHVKLDGNEN